MRKLCGLNVRAGGTVLEVEGYSFMQRHCNIVTIVRNFKTMIQLYFVPAIFFISLFALFCAGMIEAHASDQERAKIVNTYMNFAFRTNEKLNKFEERPRILFLCGNSKCQVVIDLVSLVLPSESYFKIASSLPDNATEFEIFVFFDAAEAQKETEEFKSSSEVGLELRYWGGPACFASQFYSNSHVKKLFITSTDANEGISSAVCVLLQFAQGSGGNIIGGFKTYRDQIEQASQIERKTFLAGIAFILRIHWSPFIAPGTDKEDVRRILMEHMF